MIPTITKKGTSFKGAALYYLHDKKALTNERIDFTQTQNLATDNPEMAWKMMAYTAMHQSEIKQAARGVAKGRKLTQPVYAYSLAWHPSQEPTKGQMIEAGLKTLKVLGLCEHEAILVAHNDADHKHIHLMVNRVHPETGVADKVSNDRLKLSKWAEDYERDHGQIFCDQRVANNERRRNGEYVKDREAQSKAEFYRWQREQTNQAFAQRQKDISVLGDVHKQQRQELLNNKEKLIKEQIARLKELNRPKWASIYKRQNQEDRKLEEIQSSALSRMAYYIKNRNQERKQGIAGDKQGILSGTFGVLIDRNKLTKGQIDKHEQERKAFAEKIAGQSRQALKQNNNEYYRRLEILKANTIKEQQLMKARHSQESQRRAKDIASGKSEEEFNRLKNEQLDLKDNFRHKVTGFIKKKYNDFRYVNDNRIKKTKGLEKDVGIKEEFNREKKGRAECVVPEEKQEAQLKANQSVASKTQGLDYTSNKMDKSEVAAGFNQKTNEKEKKPSQQKITTPEMKHVLKPPGVVQQTVNTQSVSPPLRDKNVVDIKKTKSPEKDTGVKEEFNKQRESRTFRFVNDNSIKKKDTLEKDSDVKKEFNKNRFTPNRQQKEKKTGRFTNKGKDIDRGI